MFSLLFPERILILNTDTSVFLAYWYWYLFSILQIEYWYWYFSIWQSYWILNTSIFILYWSGLWFLIKNGLWWRTYGNHTHSKIASKYPVKRLWQEILPIYVSGVVAWLLDILISQFRVAAWSIKIAAALPRQRRKQMISAELDFRKYSTLLWTALPRYTPGWNVWGECLLYEVNAPLLQVCYKP